MKQEIKPDLITPPTPKPTRAVRIQRSMWTKLRRAGTPWLFLLPAIVIMLIILGYPLIDIVVLSLHREILVLPDHPFIGLKNYINLNALIDLKVLVSNTLFWTIGSMIGQCIIGFIAALTLNQESRWTRFVRTLLLTPWITSPVVAAVVWSWLFEPTLGVIDAILHKPVAWLTDPHLAMPSLILINIWLGFPFWMIMITSGLKTVPADLYEAAWVDGANRLAQFWHVTLPGIRTVFEVTSLMAFIFTTNSFTLMQLLTNGGPGESTTTVSFEVYNLAFVEQNNGAAAAVAVLLTIVLSILVILYLNISRSNTVVNH